MKQSLPFLALALCILAAPCTLGAADRTVTVTTRNRYAKFWHDEKCLTADGIDGYKKRREPGTDAYGGWKTAELGATGFFRVQKHDGRWWMVTPDGHPYIFKGVACVSPGSSPDQKKTAVEKFGSESAWAEKELKTLKGCGFNGAGAWSRTVLLKDSREKFPYTVIISPLKAFEKKLYPGVNLAKQVFVFDGGLDEAVAEAMEEAEIYKNDPWCVGYFIDNEIPWRNTLLEYYLNELPGDNANRKAAEVWMKERGLTQEKLTAGDRQQFAAYVLDTYLNMAVGHLREHDRNHMFLGCRFNVWDNELSNPYAFKVAGKYMDVISVNHYAHWEPWWRRFEKWEQWSGRPELVTEFYTKGEDSGMKNDTGAGWLVKTQKDRGLFYQNFVINLLKSRSCVGWHWFKYQDNDPANTNADPSNLDSNKGIVDAGFNYYKDLAAGMKAVNSQVYGITMHYLKDDSWRKACVTLIDDDFRRGKVDACKKVFDSLGIRCSFAIIPVEKDGKLIFDKRQRDSIICWQHEGFSFVPHPVHNVWYDSASTPGIRYAGVDACEKSLKDCMAALGKTAAKQFGDYLVYPGGSGNNRDVVRMAGKYVRYGIGASGKALDYPGPRQLHRIFITPGKKTAEEYKAEIKAALDRDGYAILGTHSWAFDKGNMAFLIDILGYVKTLAEFATVPEAFPVMLE